MLNLSQRYLRHSVFWMIMTLLTLAACNRQEENAPVQIIKSKSMDERQAAAPVSSSSVLPEESVSSKDRQIGNPVLFHDKIDPHNVEEQANALTLWKKHATGKPVLLLLSAKVLRPLPTTLQEEVDRLLASDDEVELTRRVAQPVPDLLLAADLGLPAAMRQGWFSKVIWVVPMQKGSELLPLDDFKCMLQERAGGWGGDIQSFAVNEKGAHAGTLGGTPVEVVSIYRLPDLLEPLLVHMDAGFFSAIYSNEVKTPLSPMLASNFRKIAEKEYRVLGVSISHDNQSFEVPLPQRFVANDMAALVADPAKITEPTSTMKTRGEIRYLDSFFQPETIEQKVRELIHNASADADNHYVLYSALRQARQLDQALNSLEQAIALDPVYANVYIELVNHAVQKQQYPAAIAMLDSAILALPNHPLIRLRKAQMLVEMERGGEAIALLEGLQKLSWSNFYYPNIREDIEVLLKKARG